MQSSTTQREENPAPSGTFQRTFGGAFCRSGLMPVSRLMPSRFGPRNCGHHNLESLPPPVTALPASASNRPIATTAPPHNDVRMDLMLLKPPTVSCSLRHGRGRAAHFL